MAADGRCDPMRNLVKYLKVATEVLATAGAVLAAAIVVVETYQALRNKIEEASGGIQTSLPSGQP
jgi:hypothetical protein